MKQKNTFCQNFIVFYYKPSSGVLKNSLFILYCFVDNFRCNLNFWWLLFKYSGNNNNTKYKITQTCLVFPLGQLTVTVKAISWYQLNNTRSLKSKFLTKCKKYQQECFILLKTTSLLPSSQRFSCFKPLTSIN